MLKIVPFAPKHIAPFTQWFNALPENNVWNEAYVRSKTVDDETYTPELMIAAEEGGDPLGFVLGSKANDTGWIKAFLVRPDRQRQGVGTAMFDAIEDAFVKQGVQGINVGWAPPRYFIPGVNVKYTSAIVFLDRRGYETSRDARINMDVTLAGRDFGTADKEASLRTHGFITRRAAPEDKDGLTKLCEEYNNPGWAIEVGIALGHTLPTVFVAEKEGRICAFAAHSVVGPTHFGPMLTSPELRGLGIG
ncbi:MAG: GNAT family N-acetyltransferase, partial [Anaerolineae bacterium]|nr:GNAT family N-acetyltransferase [Anaerolineae bacterium]